VVSEAVLTQWKVFIKAPRPIDTLNNFVVSKKAKEPSCCCSFHVTVLILLMAQSTRSVESLVKLTYALQIATRCSEDAEQICKKNHLTFPDLLRPFSVVSEKGKYVYGCLYLLMYLEAHV
jgi:hypothetical protein